MRTFLTNEYGEIGEKAIENDGSMSTALSAMRKKMLESEKVPPVPVNVMATPPAVATLSVVEQFRIYVGSTLLPAQKAVSGGVAVAGSLSALKQAISVVEDAQAKLGDSYDSVVKAFAG